MKRFPGGEWLTSHPGSRRNMELMEGSLDAEGHVGDGKTGEGNGKKGDASPGMRVTSGKIAGCGGVGEGEDKLSFPTAEEMGDIKESSGLEGKDECICGHVEGERLWDMSVEVVSKQLSVRV